MRNGIFFVLQSRILEDASIMCNSWSPRHNVSTESLLVPLASTLILSLILSKPSCLAELCSVTMRHPSGVCVSRKIEITHVRRNPVERVSTVEERRGATEKEIGRASPRTKRPIIFMFHGGPRLVTAARLA